MEWSGDKVKVRPAMAEVEVPVEVADALDGVLEEYAKADEDFVFRMTVEFGAQKEWSYMVLIPVKKWERASGLCEAGHDPGPLSPFERCSLPKGHDGPHSWEDWS